MLNLLFEELHVDESLEELLATAPRLLKRRQYPQAIAAALVLRHSWNEDDLGYILGRLGLTAEPTVSDVRPPARQHRLTVLSAGTTASRSRVPREYLCGARHDCVLFWPTITHLSSTWLELF